MVDSGIESVGECMSRLSVACWVCMLWIAERPVCLAQDPIHFRRHLINAESEFSAGTVFDVNRDGRSDIVCGAWWYEAPTWKKHKFREVQQIRGRYDDYSNLAVDVDEDGDQDIVSVNYRSQSLYWCKNPGSVEEETLWEQFTIDEPGPSETGRLVDMDGDGKMDILPNGTKFAAWYEFTVHEKDPVIWTRHDLPAELVGHGIGAGDLNGDGRTDLVCPNGWAEAPADPRKGRWIWHPEFTLARDCGLPILCLDVDQDGDTDLVWGRGHDIGLYWTEQISESESTLELPAGNIPNYVRSCLVNTRWKTHAIDTRFACLHTLMLADIDGDGQDDLVAGKRFMGHDGKDPGENDPLNFHWYRFDTKLRTWTSYEITRDGPCGVDLDSVCADLDNDGDIDILAPARCGLHWIENLRISPDGEGSASELEPYPDYADHQDVNYYLGNDGQRHPVATALDHGIRRQHVLSQMQQVMGALPNPSRRTDLATKVTSVEEADKYWRIKLSYAPEPGDRVPAYLLLPKNLERQAPAMLCLHPTQFELGKAQICGLGGKSSRFYAHELAERGYVCLAPDYPSFADYAEYDFEGDDYVSGSMKAIWNNIRGLDLLESLPTVARDQIGVIGHSLGGHNALFTAAFDQRLRCVITSCGFTAFEDYYDGNLQGWTSERYMPLILRQYGSDPSKLPFDFMEVLAAIAPRPIFVNAPVHDSNFELIGVKKCESAVMPVYSLLGRSEEVVFQYPNADHDFPDSIRQEAYTWLESVLRD